MIKVKKRKSQDDAILEDDEKGRLESVSPSKAKRNSKHASQKMALIGSMAAVFQRPCTVSSFRTMANMPTRC